MYCNHSEAWHTDASRTRGVDSRRGGNWNVGRFIDMLTEMLKWAVEMGKVHRRVQIRYFARWSIWCLAPKQVGSTSLPWWIAILRYMSRIPPSLTRVFSSWHGGIVQRLEQALVPLSLGVLLLFVIVGIDRSVWLDEAYSIFVSNHNFAGIAEQLQNDNNLPAYYYLLAIWMRVFGDSEVATRALSGFFYICSTVATFLLGLSLFRDRRTALYGAFFFLVSTQAIHQAQNVRTYSFLSFLTALSTLAFLRLFYDGSRERWAWSLYLAVNAIGLLTHVWFFFVLVAQVAALMLWRPRTTWKKYLLATCVSSLPFLCLWLPFFREQVHNDAISWMPLFQLWFVPDALLGFYGGFPMGLLFYGTYAALVLLGGRQGLRRFISGGGLRGSCSRYLWCPLPRL
jgi:Dolichyl-phosphate-mannose-protein mannosyltransferase